MTPHHDVGLQRHIGRAGDRRALQVRDLRHATWRRVRVALGVTAILAGAAACAPSEAGRTGTAAPLPPGAEAMSLLGTPLFPPALPDSAIVRADSALAASPDDTDLLLAAAAQRASAWRFREAIDLYSRGIARDSTEARFHRFRGHRYITLRDFAKGAADLDRGAVLDSTNFDIVYHQGLAHYLLGHFDRAAEAYQRCLGYSTNDALQAREAGGAYRAGYRSCMRIATDDDARVAMTDWTWRALMRAGRSAEAEQLLQPIHAAMTVNANRSYHENLLLYKGVRTPEEVMAAAGSDSVRFSTSGYAVANYHLVRGDSVRAWELMERVAHSSHWSGFGVIAAEAELARRRP